MQTLQVIRTIRWIQALYSEETQQFFGAVRGMMSEPENTKFTGQIISVFLEMTRNNVRINNNPQALEVLEVFSLIGLANDDFINSMFESLVHKDGGHDMFRIFYSTISRPWYRMVSCVEPFETLTTPDELKGGKLPDDIISLEIRRSSQKPHRLADLSEAAKLLEAAYTTTARAYGKNGEMQLVVVKVDSGSSIRIDCRGADAVVKHLKEFIIEAWSKFRHKRPEEVMENNKAILSSLAVFQRIAVREKDKSLSREEAEQLRRKVLSSTLGLFERGALIIDIPDEEVVNNTELLQGFRPKLLEAPKEKPAMRTRKKSVKPRSKKAATRKRKR